MPRYLSVSDLAAASVKAPNASPATFMPGQLSITRFQPVLTWLSTGAVASARTASTLPLPPSTFVR